MPEFDVPVQPLGETVQLETPPEVQETFAEPPYGTVVEVSLPPHLISTALGIGVGVGVGIVTVMEALQIFVEPEVWTVKAQL